MIEVKMLGVCDYVPTLEAMKAYTESRDEQSPDQIWLLQHPAVFTQGLAGKAEHLLNPSTIPVVQIDRGGQITYHGLGQVVMYLLLDVQRKNIGIRPLVSMIEESVIALLGDYGIVANARADAPGVYVAGQKIASLGLKVRRGCTYHGAALNVAMDLTPFTDINPCGLVGMKMTQLRDLGVEASPEQVGEQWAQKFVERWQAFVPTQKANAK